MPYPDDDEDEDYDSSEGRLSKSVVICIRVDPEMARKLRAAALKADKKPCAWVRHAIDAYLAASKSRAAKRLKRQLMSQKGDLK